MSYPFVTPNPTNAGYIPNDTGSGSLIPGQNYYALQNGTNVVPTGTATGETAIWDGTVNRWVLTGKPDDGIITIGAVTPVGTAGNDSITIGVGAGVGAVAPGSVTIGRDAAIGLTAANAVAIGLVAGAGLTNSSVAIGEGANSLFASGVGAGSVAIGSYAGADGQDGSSIAIGTNAALSGSPQSSGSIVINATGNNVPDAGVGTCVIKPIRAGLAPDAVNLVYSPTTGEIIQSPAPVVGATTVFVRKNGVNPTTTFSILVSSTTLDQAVTVLTATCAATAQFDISFSNGRWLVVSSAGIWASSTADAAEWVQLTTTGLTGTTVSCITWCPYWSGNIAFGGCWVIGDSDNTTTPNIYYSRNGTQWTTGGSIDFTGFTNGVLNGIRWRDGSLVACGYARQTSSLNIYPCIWTVNLPTTNLTGQAYVSGLYSNARLFSLDTDGINTAFTVTNVGSGATCVLYQTGGWASNSALIEANTAPGQFWVAYDIRWNGIVWMMGGDDNRNTPLSGLYSSPPGVPDSWSAANPQVGSGEATQIASVDWNGQYWNAIGGSAGGNGYSWFSSQQDGASGSWVQVTNTSDVGGLYSRVQSSWGLV